MYITVHQVQLPERGHRAAAPVQQTQYSSVHQYSSTARALGPAVWRWDCCGAVAPVEGGRPGAPRAFHLGVDRFSAGSMGAACAAKRRAEGESMRLRCLLSDS